MYVNPIICPRRCASTSLSGLPVNYGLKYDQFNVVCELAELSLWELVVWEVQAVVQVKQVV